MWPNSSAAIDRDQVIERPRALTIAEIERLIGVVHERRHLAVFAPKQLLDSGRADRIGVGRRRQLGLQAINS